MSHLFPPAGDQGIRPSRADSASIAPLGCTGTGAAECKPHYQFQGAGPQDAVQSRSAIQRLRRCATNRMIAVCLEQMLSRLSWPASWPVESGGSGRPTPVTPEFAAGCPGMLNRTSGSLRKRLDFPSPPCPDGVSTSDDAEDMHMAIDIRTAQPASAPSGLERLGKTNATPTRPLFGLRTASPLPEAAVGPNWAGVGRAEGHSLHFRHTRAYCGRSSTAPPVSAAALPEAPSPTGHTFTA